MGITNEMNKKIKHLEMIERVIERLASNSFKLKGWAITVSTIVFSLAVKDNDRKLMLVTLLPLIMFWLLDSFYLQMERKFRQLFKTVQNKDEAEIDFSMDYNNAIYLGPVCQNRCQ